MTIVTFETNAEGDAVQVTTYDSGHVVRELVSLPATPDESPADWYISKGAFFDRFGALKLPILASADLTVQAIILDCTVRQYIDLQGRAADIGAALDILIAKGFVIDKAAILTTKPTDGERHK